MAFEDERVNDVLERPLSGEYRYVWLDATYLKVRPGGRVVSVAAIIATGVNADGRLPMESHPTCLKPEL